MSLTPPPLSSHSPPGLPSRVTDRSLLGKAWHRGGGQAEVAVLALPVRASWRSGDLGREPPPRQVCVEAPGCPADHTSASPLDKVVVKTKTDYEPSRKKGKGRAHRIAEFTVSVTESMSERFKVSGGGGRGAAGPREGPEPQR